MTRVSLLEIVVFRNKAHFLQRPLLPSTQLLLDQAPQAHLRAGRKRSYEVRKSASQIWWEALLDFRAS